MKSDHTFLERWRQDSIDRLIREDLRDLTHIRDLENVATLITLLPERVGNPLSINALRQDLELNHKTVQNYLKALKLCYILFELPSYARKINRALTKERKVFFFDWTRLQDDASRFENYVACELFGWVTFWTDAGLGRFELNYVRNRSGQECDFLLLKDRQPWMLIEVKLKDQRIPSHLYHFSRKLGNIPVVLLVQETGIVQAGKHKDYRISASRFLSA